MRKAVLGRLIQQRKCLSEVELKVYKDYYKLNLKDDKNEFKEFVILKRGKIMIANLSHFYSKILLLRYHQPSKLIPHYINNPLPMVFGTYGSTEDVLHFLNQNICALSNTNNGTG